MLNDLRRLSRQTREAFPKLNEIYEWARGRKHPIFLEFPVAPRPRWGFSSSEYEPIAKFLARDAERYRAVFSRFLTFQKEFSEIPRLPGPNARTPNWQNGTLPTLDAMALYTFMVDLNPKRYIEIGSGLSTKFARRAIENHSLGTKITSVDPFPRAEVDALCDVVIRDVLQNQDLGIFSQLQAGDILFLDGSHFSFQNSDTVVFFLDILPKLPAGVWVHIHDITWPVDYGPEVVDRYLSEQYLLAAYIIGGAARMQMQLPNHYCFKQLELGRTLDPLFSCPSLEGQPRVGASFWFSIT